MFTDWFRVFIFFHVFCWGILLSSVYFLWQTFLFMLFWMIFAIISVQVSWFALLLSNLWTFVSWLRLELYSVFPFFILQNVLVFFSDISFLLCFCILYCIFNFFSIDLLLFWTFSFLFLSKTFFFILVSHLFFHLPLLFPITLHWYSNTSANLSI